MQSSDALGNIKQIEQVDLNKLDELASKIKSAEEKGAVSHVIGKLPVKGEHITINGLSYRVEFADFVKGKYAVKLICRDR